MKPPFRFLTRFARARNGNVAIIVAIALPVIIGFCGLGAEVGYWYYKDRQLSSITDMAAYAGAVALSQGETTAEVKTAAIDGASANGFDASLGTLAVYTPPISGSHQDSTSVEVVTTLPIPRFFSALFQTGDVPLDARAVATGTVAPGPACVLALDPTATAALSLQGTPAINSTNCSIAVNSNAPNSINVGGSASISVPCVSSVGSFSMYGITTSEPGCANGFQHAPPAIDPYASVAAPPTTGPCVNTKGTVSTATASPGRYCKGLTVKNQTLTFEPGVYVIDGGDLSFDANAVAYGTGVTFYIVNGGSVSISSNSVVDLTAPTSGPFSGILFFGDRSATTTTVNSFQGGGASSLTGVLYFPTQTLNYAGTPGTTGCVQLVADIVNLVGTSGLSSACVSSAGMAEMSSPVGRIVKLVE